MIAVVLSTLLALRAAAPTSAAPAPAVAAPRRVDAIVLDARIAELDELQAAVRLRAGERPVHRSDRARPPAATELFAYLELGAIADDRLPLRLTLSDGRAYMRTVEAAPELRTREVATTVGNLLAGIEEDSIAPDLRDVPLPAPLQPPAPVIAKPAPAPTPRPPPAPTQTWGVLVDGVLGFAAGPPAPQGLAFGGLGVRGELRRRRGALFAAGLRAGVRSRDGFVLTRVRIELAGGYAWRRDAFELVTTLGLTIEPWFVTAGGRIPDGLDRRPASSLLGGVLRAAPMWRKPLRTAALRVGPFVELAGGAVPTRGGGVARVRSGPGADDRDVFRVGGLELAIGLAVGVWRSPR